MTTTPKTYLTLEPNGDPYGSGFVATEGDPNERYHIYRGDIGARSRSWWRNYAARNGHILCGPHR